MSEEEQKAIESLRKNRGVSFAYPNVIVMEKDIKTVLNLIDNQQREIEKFRGIKNGTTIIYKGKAKYVREDKINKYYISKDKIRKIINIRNNDDWYEDDYIIAVRKIRELLEE